MSELKRTMSEIAAEVTKAKDEVFSFRGEVLLPFLDFEHAKPFLKDTVTAEQWGPSQIPLTTEAVLAAMAEYMEFALDKAENHRGLSAGRSISKFRGWLWLLDDQELSEFADADQNYAQYGAPILLKICEKYGFTASDDPGFLNMAHGLPCRSDCDEGCGS